MGPEFRTPARTHVDVHHVKILVNAINLGYLQPPPLLPLHFLYGRITERTPPLLQVDTWHRRQMIRISSTLHAQLGVVGGSSRSLSALPRHDLLHLRAKRLCCDLLAGGGELVIQDAERLSAHQPSPGLRSRRPFRIESPSFSRYSLTEKLATTNKPPALLSSPPNSTLCNTPMRASLDTARTSPCTQEDSNDDKTNHHLL